MEEKTMDIVLTFLLGIIVWIAYVLMEINMDSAYEPIPYLMLWIMALVVIMTDLSMETVIVFIFGAIAGLVICVIGLLAVVVGIILWNLLKHGTIRG